MPSTLAAFAGLVPATITGEVELRAMYGGLQSAVGVIAVIGALRPALESGALLTLTCLYVGLCSTRIGSAVMLGDSSAYTIGAASFESLSAVICILLLRRQHGSNGLAPSASSNFTQGRRYGR